MCIGCAQGEQPVGIISTICTSLCSVLCGSPAAACCSPRFRHAEFYREVRRILKPSGTFAAWTYGVPVLNHRQHPAQAVLHQLYEGTLGPYWAGPRKHVELGYRGIEPSAEDFLVVVRRELELLREQTVDELVSTDKGEQCTHAGDRLSTDLSRPAKHSCCS